MCPVATDGAPAREHRHCLTDGVAVDEALQGVLHRGVEGVDLHRQGPRTRLGLVLATVGIADRD